MDKDFVIPVAVGPEGTLVPPHKAQKGIIYHCLECRDKVVFRKGEIKIPHFAHHGDSKCNPETILHKAGKLCIVETVKGWQAGTLQEPAIIKKHRCGRETIGDLPDGIERSLIEHRIASGRILDVALLGAKEVLLGIEIYVTHLVDAAKKTAIPYPWIELDAQELLDHPLRWVCRQEASFFEDCSACNAYIQTSKAELDRIQRNEIERLSSMGGRVFMKRWTGLGSIPMERTPRKPLEWDASVKAMVTRLNKIGPAKEGFDLGAGVTVLDPVKFHQKMLDEAKAGPKSAASRIGSFQSQLAQYLKARGETV